MEDFDTTPVDENESECPDCAKIAILIEEIDERLDRLLIRIANLETQRTPQDENDDPEWF